MRYSQGMSAGIVLVVVIGIICAAGALLGYLVGSPVFGALLFMPLGLVGGIWTVWRVYMKPLQEQMQSKDYSHLKSDWDDD
jgi:hypothetical protein